MANITKFDPVGDMVSLRHAMDRLFEDSFVSPAGWRTLGTRSEAISPALDVHENADEIVITCALPGVKVDDVEITMTGQDLTLRGEFKTDDEIKGDQYLYRERRFGTFHRSLQLPVRVHGERAEASFADGILTLRIPKSEDVKPRQIRINAGTSDAGEKSENGSADS